MSMRRLAILSFKQTPLTSLRRFCGHISCDSLEGCWLWQGYIMPNGYGYGNYLGTRDYAHRHAYRIWRGAIPDQLTIDHLCKTRHCVNPEHMEIVTRGENCLRGDSLAAKNARKTHCQHGHAFDGENLIVRKNGQRWCKECNRRWHQNYYHAYRKHQVTR